MSRRRRSWLCLETCCGTRSLRSRCALVCTYQAVLTLVLVCGACSSSTRLNDAFAPADDGRSALRDVATGETGGGNPDQRTSLSIAQTLVRRLEFARFKDNIAKLASFGSRHWAQDGNDDAVSWVEEQLASFGYAVERHSFSYRGTTKHNVYATRVGSDHPEGMYLVSGHVDSFNTNSSSGRDAPGADDDASGVSLVLEAARVFAATDLQLSWSARFVIWNVEEMGLIGAKAYVAARKDLRGVEHPPGSGLYPEPDWRGMIQHDMILYDHGLPPASEQDPKAADIDIEYDAENDAQGGALTLAQALLRGNQAHSSNYPAEIGRNMSNTDSVAFAEHCPAVSVRENQRLAEIGRGANPHWHKSSDVPETYSDADYRLGFNAAQMTVGALAELVEARHAP